MVLQHISIALAVQSAFECNNLHKAVVPEVACDQLYPAGFAGTTMSAAKKSLQKKKPIELHTLSWEPHMSIFMSFLALCCPSSYLIWLNLDLSLPYFTLFGP